MKRKFRDRLKNWPILSMKVSKEASVTGLISRISSRWNMVAFVLKYFVIEAICKTSPSLFLYIFYEIWIIILIFCLARGLKVKKDWVYFIYLFSFFSWLVFSVCESLIFFYFTKYLELARRQSGNGIQGIRVIWGIRVNQFFHVLNFQIISWIFNFQSLFHLTNHCTVI